jgi:hypothetical protein
VTRLAIIVALASTACHASAKPENPRTEERLLAVGGTHALEGTEPCQLTQVEPATALEDLHWKDALVVRARGEGHAALACGNHRARLRLVKPDRLELVLVDDHVTVGQRFDVRAVARDRSGRELEIGKWTEIAWRGDSVVALDEDASAGEFGVSSTSFGVHGFRASATTAGTIEARLGEAAGTLQVTARP